MKKSTLKIVVPTVNMKEMGQTLRTLGLDQRDIPDTKFGKTKLPKCKCAYNFTCKVCLDYAASRQVRLS